jgi:hypothetical protein
VGGPDCDSPETWHGITELNAKRTLQLGLVVQTIN